MIKRIRNFLILISLSALFSLPALAQTASLLPNAKQTFLDSNGNPLSSGTVTFYIPSTTTLKTTWIDGNKVTANPNPLTLDAAGRAIIYGDGNYRQVVKDIKGNTIWDQVTSSTGAGGGGGTLVGDGNLVATVLPWVGLVAPAQYVFAYGQEISRATYATFFTAITLTATVTCTLASPILTNLADTTQIPVGAFVETTCVAPGTTVLSKTTTTITVSNNATISSTASSVIFPWGNGDGSTTFNVPDFRGRVLPGRDNMGGTASSRLTSTYYGELVDAIGANGGSQSKTLITGNLPAYTPTGTVAITDPGHTHAQTNASSGSGFSIAGGGTTQVAGTTATASATTGITAAFTGAAQGGTSTAFATIQPSITVNYVIKITPDVSSSIASGVASLGGMTGVIACGTGLTCTSNTVSVTGLTGPANYIAYYNGAGNISSLANIPVTNLNSGTNASASTFWRGDGTWANATAGNVFLVSNYATCDGVTDATVGLQALATAVRAAGGGVIEFPNNANCQVFPTPIVGAQTVLALSGTDGVIINFNGSCIRSAASFAGGKFVRVIEAVTGTTTNMTVNGFCAVQTTDTAASITGGFQGFYLQDTIQGLVVNGAYQQYGATLFECTRTASLALASRARGIKLNNMISDTVYYGISLTKNCDQTTVNLTSTNNARSIIVHGVSQFNCDVKSTPGNNTAQDMSLGVIAVSTESAAMNTLSEVNCKYFSDAQTASHSASTWLFAEYDTVAAASLIRNVRIQLDVSIASAANTPIGFMLTKQIGGVGTCVTATLGNTLENVTVTGSMTGFANNIDPVQIGQCGTWSGETVRNIVFNNVATTGSGTGAWRIDGTGLGAIQFQGIVSAHNMTVTNQASTYICRQASWANSVDTVCGYSVASTVLSGAAISMTTATPANITSISLLPGTYRICGEVATVMNGATTPTAINGAINTTSATLPTLPGSGAFLQMPIPSGTGQNYGMPIGCRRAVVAATQTWYLVGQASFAVNTLSMYGFIEATRMD